MSDPAKAVRATAFRQLGKYSARNVPKPGDGGLWDRATLRLRIRALVANLAVIFPPRFARKPLKTNGSRKKI